MGSGRAAHVRRSPPLRFGWSQREPTIACRVERNPL
jgi:hypothetical protein